MDDKEFDQISQILFKDVNSLVKIGYPGVLIPMTNDTRAVLCGDNSANVIVVATRIGQGRCLVFGHKGYLSIFTKPKEYIEEVPFVSNCKQWLSKGLSSEVIEIDNERNMLNVAKQNKILIWDGHCLKDETFIADLCKYLESGGALICAATAWGWLQGNSGKTLADFPFARFCDSMGVKLTGSMADVAANPVPFQADLVKFNNIYQTIENLNTNCNDKELFSIIGVAIREIGEVLPGIPLETLEQIVMNAGHEMIPAKSCPIKDKKCREQSNALCGIMRVLPGIKAPGVHSFPGDFDQPPQLDTNISCNIESNAKQWHCTGYYVAAGIPIQIDVAQQDVAGWSVRIGCHSDDLKNCNELRRWHCISICKLLTIGTVTLSSAFGGLLFFESPDDRSSSITVTLHNVVLTPTYDLSDPDRADSWKYKQENAQGLWADIAGEYIVFNVPSTSVLNLDSSLLDRVLGLWDSCVLSHHELLGTKPTRRERIVSDEQASVGYMHCGYPVVAHLDVSDPKAKNYVFNINTLEKDGAWGLFHELGHNRQRGWWTFDGSTEVTVNIFTLYSMDKICHNAPWIHSWLIGQIAGACKYIENGAKFTEWKQKPGVALFVYAQLAREYGWDSYKAVFRKYEEIKPTLNSNQEKIDYWITTFSRQVNQNLIPLFNFWGFPISQSTIDGLSGLEIPSITDMFIESAPQRYTLSV